MTGTGEEDLPWLDNAPKSEIRRVVGALHRVHSLMGALTDLDTLLSRIGDESRLVAGAEAASVILYDESADELYFRTAVGDRGDQEALKREIRLKMGQGIAGSAAAARASLNISDAASDPRFYRGADTATRFSTRNLLAVPMIDRGRLVGVLEVVNKIDAPAFSPLDTHVMEMFSSIAATAVVNAQLIERQIKTEQLAAIGQAIAGMTHHIKNIITGLNSSAELIEMAMARNNQELAAKTWPVLRRSVQRISNFVQDLLTFSKPRKPVRQRCAVGVIIHDACDSVRDLFNTKRITLEIDADAAEKPVWIDADAVYRCLLNLIHNAADALPEAGGRVAVTARLTAQGALEIDVADNGPGIPPEIRNQIFMPFFSTKGTKGTGLGLATSVKVAREHGGDITLAHSEEGACFRITLADADAGAAAP